MIKPELQEEWDKFVKENSQDAYSRCCVDATENVLKALVEGKSPQEAYDAMYGYELTGFMAGCVAQTVAHFSPRGEDFRIYWNERWGVSNADAPIDGVINPAIITIHEDR